MPHRHLLILLCLIALTACVQTRQVGSTWDTWRGSEWSDTPAPGSDKAFTSEEARERRRAAAERRLNAGRGYAILLEHFDSDGDSQSARRRATNLVATLKKDTYMPDVWAREEENGISVYRGQFPSDNAREAQLALKQTRTALVNGSTPYEQVQLVALADGTAESFDESNLRAYSDIYEYTLQVAAFDEAGGKKFRKLAEEYAQQLRAGGDDAFYYHGKFRSMVTVGLFTDADFIQQRNVRAYGPHIRDLQQRFPHNLVNGMTIVESNRGEQIGAQPSSLVRIP